MSPAPRPVFLVTGATGQVGRELVRELAPLGRVCAPGRDVLDLARPETLREAVRSVRPDAVVNAAAYTAVDQAERDAAACEAVNATAPGVLAEEAASLGIPLVHYSTDYVFDGRASAPYREDDPTGPLQVYGRTKLSGERAVAAAGGAHLVLRTSWVYGTRGRNFLGAMLRAAATQPECRVVNDQRGAPTWSRLVAATTAHILAQLAASSDGLRGLAAVSGTYHLTAAGAVTWYEFAEAIFDAAGRRLGTPRPRLHAVSTAEYGASAPRPAWSVLDTSKLRATFGLHMPDWREQLELVMDELPA